MRNLVLGSVIVATAALTAVPASAATTTIFTPGVFTNPNPNASIFESFENRTPGAFTPSANETSMGSVIVATGTVPGTTVDPDSNPNNKYLSIENGSFGVTFGTPVQFFSFILGSLDSYNSVTLNFVGGTSQTLTGTQIIGATGTGPFNSSTSGRVSYDFNGGAGLTSAVFTSTQAAFEIDDLASAVPEPAAWALMILGFGVVGGQLRSRRRKVAVSFA